MHQMEIDTNKAILHIICIKSMQKLLRRVKTIKSGKIKGNNFRFRKRHELDICSNCKIVLNFLLYSHNCVNIYL